MKRLIGILIAAGGIAALLLLATFGDSENNFTFLQAVTAKGATDEATTTLQLLYGEKGILLNLFDMIKSLIDNGAESKVWIEFGYYAAAVLGLPLFMILAGLCKKFGRFFWGLLALACGVVNILVWKEVLPIEDLGIQVYFALIQPYIGYWIATGCSLLIIVTAFIKEKKH